MTPRELKEWLLNEVDRYPQQYEPPEPGITIGVPWTKEKVAQELATMRRCVIDPYMSDFLFHDTVDQINADPQIRKRCWVVAEDPHYRMLFDPDTQDFVLAEKPSSGDGEWVTIGVRGDPVGTFLAR